MKRISFFLVLTLILFSFGLANAEQSVSLSSVDGYFFDATLGAATAGDCIAINAAAEFHIHVVNDEYPDCFWLPAFGFQVCDGGAATAATWTWAAPGDPYGSLVADEVLFVDNPYPGVYVDVFFEDPVIFSAVYKEFQGETGADCDSIGYAGINTAPPSLWGPTQQSWAPGGVDHDVFKLLLTPTAQGSILCLDIAVDMPSYEWGWSPLAFDAGVGCSASDTQADWDGPHCFTVEQPPDLCPKFTDCTEPDHNPTSIEGSHCATLTGAFCAVDPDPGEGPGPDDVTYAANIGIIDGDGNWSGGPWACADVGTSISLIVVASEVDNPTCANADTTNIILTNLAPSFTSGCGASSIISAETEGFFLFEASDPCNDAITMELVDDAPLGTGTASPFDGSAVMMGGDSLVIYVNDACVDDFYDFEVIVFDCKDTNAVACVVTVQVIHGDPYEVAIEKTHDTPQGQFAKVKVTMVKQAEGIGGFNFLIAYDASALTFQGADIDGAVLYEQCGWEYFTYRYGPFGNCGNACPSGLLRVVGIGETNNGPHHPSCFGGPSFTPYLMFNLNFLVSNNRTFECMYVPIRFFWIECGDNTISNQDGTILFISNTVWEYSWDDTDYWQNIAAESEMPTWLGAPYECVTDGGPEKPAVERAIGFYNGGIDIVCSKDIDDRGDINLNGLAYEIADAVMFSNYFVYGLSAFVTGAENGSIAATDVNADGLTLSVADLVYLIRVIVGDALPYDDPFLKPTITSYTYHNGVVNVPAEMGAAAFVFSGDADVELLAANMDLITHYNGTETRALVWSQNGETFTGDVVRGDGMVSMELGSADGATVITELLPSEFALNQNYPNPFNPTATIGFALPTASEVTLTVYNVTGQVVSQVSGDYEAGNHELEFNGSDLSSGIYFYRLDAGDFTDTKKMVILK